MKRFFGFYLRARAPLALALLLSCGAFALVFYLYGLPSGAAGYPCIICAVLWLLFLCWDVFHTWKRFLAYEQARALAAELEGQRRTLDQTLTRRYTDTVEYYTLWAHQIKTPIASLRLTLQNEDDPKARRLLTDLSRIEQYVEMALVYLRLDSQSSDYVLRNCDLDGILRGAVKKLSSQFIDRKLSLDYQPIRATALTDEKWLSFVIEQVLSNALKYTAQGSITITLEEPLTLCVADTGMGIAREDLPRVFEKGYTGYNGRSDKQASGIGLYLCKRICENLGHTIRIESTLGEGTCVRIGLERKKLEIE